MHTRRITQLHINQPLPPAGVFSYQAKGCHVLPVHSNLALGHLQQCRELLIWNIFVQSGTSPSPPLPNTEHAAVHHLPQKQRQRRRKHVMHEFWSEATSQTKTITVISQRKRFGRTDALKRCEARQGKAIVPKISRKNTRISSVLRCSHSHAWHSQAVWQEPRSDHYKANDVLQ